MDLNLTKFFYTQVDSVREGSLVILIGNLEKNNHRVIIADGQGQMSYFTKNGPELVKKMASDPSRRKISKIQIIYSTSGKKSLMYALGNEIKAVNAAGKEYFCFESNVAEPIQWVRKEGKSQIFTCGEYILNFYNIENSEIDDLYQFNCPAQILDFYVHCLDGVHFYPIITCKDRGVRVINTEGIVYQFKLSGEGSCMKLWMNCFDSQALKNAIPKDMVFGQSDGIVTCYRLSQFKEKQLWTLYPKNSKAGVVCLSIFNFTQSRNTDLLVGRNDTSVEIFMDMSPAGSTSPMFEMRGTITMEETITNLECAFFGLKKKPECLITTYSGKIFGIANEENQHLEEVTNQAGKEKAQKKKFGQMQNEIAQLEAQIKAEFTKQQQSDDGYTAQIHNRVDWKMDRIRGEGNKFEVRIDSQYPIELAVIEKNKFMQFSYENQPGLLIRTPKEFSQTHEFISIDFTTERSSRLSFAIEPVEGVSCDLHCYITPDLPNKIAQAVIVPIKPLCTHFRVSEMPANLVTNNLIITGTFTPSRINNWLFKILPDISSLAEEDEVEMAFQNSASQAFLHIFLETNKAVFKSQSVSTISIIKQCLFLYAAEENTTLSMGECSVKEQTLNFILTNMEIAYENSKTLALQVKVIDALREIENQEGGLQMLSEDKKELLYNAEKVLTKHKQIPKQLEMYNSIVINLYKDYRLLKGLQSFPKLDTLHNLLKDFDKTEILKLIIS